ncbi:hypothetical protein JCM8547_005783 [Rhodosporidiobolus lusitaniae]
MPVAVVPALSTASAIDAAIRKHTSDPFQLSRFVFMAASSSNPLVYSGKGGYAQLPPHPATKEEIAEKGEPISEESIFELFSCTKLVGSVAALQLVEQGLVGLDEDASRYVPQLKEAMVFKGFDDQGEPILEEKKAPVTIRQLLTHTSGAVYFFHDLASNEKLSTKYGIERSPYGGLEVTPDSLYKMPLFFQPGEDWAYGTSIDWLTRVVENVSGLDLETYMQQRIFGPLGITDISYSPNPSQISMAFRSESDPSAPLTLAPAKPMSPKHRYGGAGLKGSPSSYLVFLRALLRGGALDPSDEATRILKSVTVDMMFEPQLNEKQVERLKKQESWGSSPFNRREECCAENANWGLGGMLSATVGKGRRAEGALTWSGMANTFWVIDRKRDVVMAIFSNVQPYADEKVFAAWEEVETLLYEGLGYE